MIPILITGATEEERRQTAKAMASEFLGVAVDRLESQPDLQMIVPSPSITIAQVREMVSKLSRKPLATSVSLAIIYEANLATFEAQNALLKSLEEPFPSTRIILTSPNKDFLLPTVASRCLEVQVRSKTTVSENANFKQDSDLVEYLLLSPPERRLAKLDQITLSKPETLTLLTRVLLIAEQKLLSSKDINRQKMITLFIRAVNLARQHIAANVNIRLALARFLLSF